MIESVDDICCNQIQLIKTLIVSIVFQVLGGICIIGFSVIDIRKVNSNSFVPTVTYELLVLSYACLVFALLMLVGSGICGAVLYKTTMNRAILNIFSKIFICITSFCVGSLSLSNHRDICIKVKSIDSRHQIPPLSPLMQHECAYFQNLGISGGIILINGILLVADIVVSCVLYETLIFIEDYDITSLAVRPVTQNTPNSGNLLEPIPEEERNSEEIPLLFKISKP